MKSSPDKRHGNRCPEIWVERSGASAYPSSGKPVTEKTHTENPVVVKAPPSAALSAAPIRQPSVLSARQHRYRRNARCC